MTLNILYTNKNQNHDQIALAVQISLTHSLSLSLSLSLSIYPIIHRTWQFLQTTPCVRQELI